MKISTYTNHHTTCTVEKHESWRMTNDRGLPFMVRQIFMSGTRADKVHVEGWAILVDGTQGVTQRNVSMKLADLPLVIRTRMLSSHKDMMKQVAEEIERMTIPLED